MGGQFTENAKSVINLAKYEAIRLQQDYVGTEHLLLGIIKEGTGAAIQILNNLGVDINEIKRKTEESIVSDGGTMLRSSMLPITPRARKVLENAGIEARNMSSALIGTEHLLLSLIRDPESQASAVLVGMGLDYEQIKEASSHVEKEKEMDITPGTFNPSRPPEFLRRQPLSKSMTPFLDHYGRNLNTLAKEGKLDPVIGRVKEIERVIQILSRRKKNNPLLIGEPGIGKTAIIEGLAQKIVNRDIPQILENKVVYSLDLSGVVAGTTYRGQFEERMKALIAELQKNENIIVFIDEIHTIVGAGSASGTLDAANIFKPALARGEVKCVGATTLDEYRKYFESDAALDRRFQTIMVEPPSVAETIQIIDGLKKAYEDHHKVKYTDRALKEAVVLSDRYISDRFLPDKAIDVIDEAGAFKRLSGLEIPQEIRELEQKLEEIEKAKSTAASEQNYEEAAKQKKNQDNIKDTLKEINQKWRENINENVLIVDEQIISRVISTMTGIPLNQLEEQESQKLLHLEEHLRKNVIGQEEALAAVARSIRRNRAGLRNIKRPIASFIFLGPTGVGKTELAKALAKELFNSEDALVRIDMSEFMEKFEVSKLIGSAPGFVGYDDGAGQLSEKVRKKPYSVVLFDEIEKAHPDIFNILLQILDDGRLTDSHGRHINFKNTIIIMTSNAGTRDAGKKGLGFTKDTAQSVYEIMKSRVTDELKKIFTPEFLNRVDETIVFRHLTKEDIKKIIDIRLAEFKNRLEEKKVDSVLTDAFKDFILEKGFDADLGARPLQRAIQRNLEDILAEAFLMKEYQEGDSIVVDVEDGKVVVRKTE
ncbi:MAG: ATP-dependent Clp protease ATP-binding subunit [Chitinispirillales bacterium]|jgi:ATP-dependent Clp protease ATP-binding subunit ClpC|nr:ATP-dependent Clp protease ATP-binding subunit [Chitinispirillales bacterium]